MVQVYREVLRFLDASKRFLNECWFFLGLDQRQASVNGAPMFFDFT